MPSTTLPPLLSCAVLLCAAVLRAQDYDHQVLAQTGVNNLTQISYHASINDAGLVAFSGADTNGGGLWVADAPGGARLICNPPNGALRFTGASISGEPPYEVASRDHFVGAPGTYQIRKWPADGSLYWQRIGISPANFASASGWLEINDGGVVAAQVVLASGGRGLYVGDESSPPMVVGYSTLAKIHPQIANDNRVVFRDESNQIVVMLYPTATADVISGFSKVGSDPGISPDGRAIAFVGDRGQGEGLFVALEDPQNPGGFLIGRIGGEGQDLFSDFDEESQRVGVASCGDLAYGSGVSVVVCVVGTWNGVQGLYTVDATLSLDAAGALQVAAEPPRAVVRVGDPLAGSAVASVLVTDPINGCGQVAHSVFLQNGESAVVRSTRKLTDVRVSVKRVLGPNAQAASWTLLQAQTWLNDASAVLEKYLRVRLVVTEVVDLPDPHLPNSWFAVGNSTFVRPMELVAEYDPCGFAWRPDAINVYLVDSIQGAGGVCSFPVGSSPTENDLILMAPTSSNRGVALAHEIGHYLNLRHTHANFEVAGAGCPGGSCGDCVDDTWDDTDPSVCSGFACHNANLLALNYPQHAYELLRYNVMSYHGPLTTANARLSCGQILRAWDGLRRRSHVVVGGTAPSIAAATPASGAYPGPLQVTVDGADFPTTGSVAVGVGRLETSNLTLHTASRVQAVFPDPIEPGDLCVTLRRDGQLVAAKGGLMRITPSLVPAIEPAGPSLRLTAHSSASVTPMAILVGTPLLPAVAVPGILFQLELTPAPFSLPVLTGPNAQGSLVFPVGGVASGSSVTFQGLELTQPSWRFTNPARVAIP